MLLSSCAGFALLFFSMIFMLRFTFPHNYVASKTRLVLHRPGRAVLHRMQGHSHSWVLFPSLGHKYSFQLARTRFPFHASMVLPFPPQAAISQISFYLGYCEKPILLLGKNSNLCACSADADSSHSQSKVEQDHHGAHKCHHFRFSGL